jgi:hypothetical protein
MPSLKARPLALARLTGALALFLAAGALATAPALRHADSEFLTVDATPIDDVPHPGDHLQSVYRLWLLGEQVERGRVPWRDPYTFRTEAPEQPNPAAWPLGVVFWPLVAALGPVVAWNVLVLLGFGAAGMFGLLWLEQLGVGFGAALAGGVAFALAPYRVAQSGGHLLGLEIMLLPLALWCWERGRHGSRWWLVASGAALASLPLSGQVHVALWAIPFFAFYALVRTRRRHVLQETAAGVALAVVAGLLVHDAAIEGSTLRGGRSLDEVRHYQADWLDFFSRDPRGLLEQFVFLGWLLPLLALGGLVALALARRWLLAALLLVAAAVPVLLAVGTNLPVYEPLRDVFPPLRYPRVPERLLPVACLALAALAAFAVHEVVRRLPRWTAVGAAALAVAAVGADLRADAGVFESAPADEGNRAYAVLPEGGVLDVPVFRPDLHYSSSYQYYVLQAPGTRPGGYSTVAPPEADTTARRLERINCGDWSPEVRALLERVGVRWIALHPPLFVVGEGRERAWFAERGLLRNGFRELVRDGGVITYRSGRARTLDVEGEPPHGKTVLCQGWDGTTTSDGRAAFWLHGSGLLRIELEASPPTRTVVSVDGAPLPARVVSLGSSIEVDVFANAWHLVALEPERPGVRLVRASFSAD